MLSSIFFSKFPTKSLRRSVFSAAACSLSIVGEQKQLLERYQKHEPKLVSGGSVANSVIAFSQLGGSAAFIGCVGDDRYGLFYASEFEELGIDIGNPIIVNESTGTCVCIITPDAERTMRTCLAVSSHLAARHVEEERIKNAEWLFIEGYVFANPETGQTAIREAIGLPRSTARRSRSPARTHSSLRSSATRCTKRSHTPISSSATKAKRCAVTKAGNAEEAFNNSKETLPSVVVTNGPHGAYIRHDGIEAHVPAFPTEPKDLTGAGDMFAGAFLYGITHGVAPEKAARAASYLSHKVIIAGRRAAASRDAAVLG